MVSLKRIFIALFFFQLAIAAGAHADTILNHYKKSGPKADNISRLHHNIISIVQQQEVSDDSPESDGNDAGRSKFYIRFLHNRTNHSGILLPARQCLLHDIAALVVREPVQNFTRVACRPAYYNFLFRLSPF